MIANLTGFRCHVVSYIKLFPLTQGVTPSSRFLSLRIIPGDSKIEVKQKHAVTDLTDFASEYFQVCEVLAGEII